MVAGVLAKTLCIYFCRAAQYAGEGLTRIVNPATKQRAGVFMAAQGAI
jgi:hypothetical protein